MRHVVYLLLVFALSLSTIACSNAGYYTQSIKGQWHILRQREVISEILDKADTPTALKVKLAYIQAARDFASQHLHLPDNDSYRSYADLKRDYVVWNVFAAEEFSSQAKSWCFPFAGCVSYRGYFSPERARDFADGLRRQGYDTYVAGIGAYSTLGWFDDPVLNTMLQRSESEIAALIFHELAHQVLYVKNDTQFNESFATVVEQEGTRRWLLQRNSNDQYRDYLQAKQRRKEFVALVMNLREQLTQLYEQNLDADSKRQRKRELFSDLQADYEALKKSWNGYAAYDRWFAQDLNNAHLVSIGAYNEYVPALQALLQREGDLTAFYDSARQLAQLPVERRKQELLQLTHRVARSHSPRRAKPR